MQNEEAFGLLNFYECKQAEKTTQKHDGLVPMGGKDDSEAKPESGVKSHRESLPGSNIGPILGQGTGNMCPAGVRIALTSVCCGPLISSLLNQNL